MLAKVNKSKYFPSYHRVHLITFQYINVFLFPFFCENLRCIKTRYIILGKWWPAGTSLWSVQSQRSGQMNMLLNSTDRQNLSQHEARDPSNRTPIHQNQHLSQYKINRYYLWKKGIKHTCALRRISQRKCQNYRTPIG